MNQHVIQLLSPLGKITQFQDPQKVGGGRGALLDELSTYHSLKVSAP